MLPSNGAHDFEAAKMGSEQEATCATLQMVKHNIFTVHHKIEKLSSVVE
jgi:hypothetical protein